jgi:hypothetical protein
MPSVGSVLRELHIPWPAANESGLRDAAAAWANLAETIRDNHGMANSAAASLTSNNSGQAIDAFESYWSKFGGTSGLLPRGADACDAMASACNQYADAVAEAKRKIEEAGAEVAAALVIGTIGAFFTFGASEAVADSIAAGLTETVADIFFWLGDQVGLILDDAMYTVAQAVGSDVAQSIVTSGVVGSLTGAGGTVFSDAAEDSVRQLFGQKPLTQAEVAKDVFLYGAVGGGLTGSLAKAGELTATQLSQLLTSGSTAIMGSDPYLAERMAGLAKFLYGTSGKVSAGVLATATSQLAVAQQLDAQGIISDQLQDLLQRAAEGAG